ncbi:uncharacterized protein EV154DRAFT_476381 [Mucor mucedo]|uniref:uncharacterized protein n=1 Tax=Mucor mucedo TaxID=29922 RepID=UPI00221F7F6C|nr:uncharacterized protein EV154DRAFT_476381 [Mucor mucedo]KAI7896365.1 hypothetical protein EV154DRAFT_476381 [Mucor mucedo]
MHLYLNEWDKAFFDNGVSETKRSKCLSQVTKFLTYNKDSFQIPVSVKHLEFSRLLMTGISWKRISNSGKTLVGGSRQQVNEEQGRGKEKKTSTKIRPLLRKRRRKNTFVLILIDGVRNTLWQRDIDASRNMHRIFDTLVTTNEIPIMI